MATETVTFFFPILFPFRKVYIIAFMQKINSMERKLSINNL